MSETYEIYGVDPSYFTQKLLAVFAYKQIPFNYIHKTFDKAAMVEENAGTKLIPVIKRPDETWGYDTTPIALELDDKFAERQLLPDNAALSFVVRAIEDYFDEWLTRPAVHFRWHYDADREVGGGGIVRNVLGLSVDAEVGEQHIGAYGQIFAVVEKWALRTCDNIAASGDDKKAVEAEFLRVMTLLDNHFEHHDFILDKRPCLADFAIYGGLKAHFLFDPTPSSLVQKNCPNILKYLSRLEHSFTDGEVGNWPTYAEGLPDTLLALLAEISANFHGFMALNKIAVTKGQVNVVCHLEGYGERTIVTRKYTDECRHELYEELANLNSGARQKLEVWLNDTNVLEIYKQD